MERKITFKGSPLTLTGKVLDIGSPAPDFRVSAQDLKDVTLADFKGKVKIFTTFPSLDTPVCDLQVKEFNKRAAAVSSDVVIIGVSRDLPFAQKRFCESFDIHNIFLVSDYKDSSFGLSYGLLIKELALLARAALIVDRKDIVRYIQIAPEVTAPLNYAEVLKSLDEVLRLM